MQVKVPYMEEMAILFGMNWELDEHPFSTCFGVSDANPYWFRLKMISSDCSILKGYQEKILFFAAKPLVFFQGLEARLSNLSHFRMTWNHEIMSISGWWFGTWLLFSHILGRIIPTDFPIFQRGLSNHQPDFILHFRWFSLPQVDWTFAGSDSHRASRDPMGRQGESKHHDDSPADDWTLSFAHG